jgi:BlaI family transcriptional regulator, penicillinase repressor
MVRKISISAAESQVMESLWRKSPLTAEEIIAATASANDWGAGTVRTLISRLLHKKVLAGARKKGGYFYRPLVSRADYVRAESQTLLDRLFQGQAAPLVLHFAKHRALKSKDIRELLALLEKMEDDDD